MIKIKLNVKNVRHRLDVKCMPYKDLAQGLGISACYLSQLINGRRNPSSTLRMKFMKVLGCDNFDELFVFSDASEGEKTYEQTQG